MRDGEAFERIYGLVKQITEIPQATRSRLLKRLLNKKATTGKQWLVKCGLINLPVGEEMANRAPKLITAPSPREKGWPMERPSQPGLRLIRRDEPGTLERITREEAMRRILSCLARIFDALHGCGIEDKAFLRELFSKKDRDLTLEEHLIRGLLDLLRPPRKLTAAERATWRWI